MIGSRARFEFQAMEPAFMNKSGAGSLRSRDDSQSQRRKLFDRFRWERRPSDKHREFIEQLQFPKGNNPRWGGLGLGLSGGDLSPGSRSASPGSEIHQHNQVVSRVTQLE